MIVGEEKEGIRMSRINGVIEHFPTHIALNQDQGPYPVYLGRGRKNSAVTHLFPPVFIQFAIQYNLSDHG